MAQKHNTVIHVLTSPDEQATGATDGSAHWEPEGQIVQVILPVLDA